MDALIKEGASSGRISSVSRRRRCLLGKHAMTFWGGFMFATGVLRLRRAIFGMWGSMHLLGSGKYYPAFATLRDCLGFRVSAR